MQYIDIKTSETYQLLHLYEICVHYFLWLLFSVNLYPCKLPIIGISSMLNRLIEAK